MKRATNLFDRICTRDNIRVAFYRAARGKRSRSVVQGFASGLEDRIDKVSSGLQNGSFEFGRFRQFVIRDPKERVISAPCFEERVAHHAIMNICEPILDRWLITDTYACRYGKGREAAVRRARVFSGRFTYCIHLDVRKFFDNISHDRLLSLLQRRFNDARLLALMERVIRCYRRTQGKGLPIGSLTSQHFANFYLGWLDRFVKEKLQVRGYVRYMDDLVLWGTSKEFLHAQHQECRGFAGKTLELEFKPSRIRAVNQGVGFLGCRVWPDHVELNRRSKRRWRRRVRSLGRAERLGLLTQSELQVRLASLVAFARGADARSWRFRQAVLQQTSVNDPMRLEPREPGRQLEQQRRELQVGQPQQERPVEPQQQQRLPRGPEFRWRQE